MVDDKKYLLEDLKEAFDFQEALDKCKVGTYGIHCLKLPSIKGNGTIQFVNFGNGMFVIDFDITLKDHATLNLGNINKCMVYMMYATKGICFHNFKHTNKSRRIEEYRSSVVVSDEGSESEISISKDIPFVLSIICLDKERYFKRFLNDDIQGDINYRKSLDTFQLLNNQMFTSSYSLKIAEQLRVNKHQTNNYEISNLIRFESRYQLMLALHLEQLYMEIYDKTEQSHLNKTELKKISMLTEYIVYNPEIQHSIKNLCDEASISPAKLQQGFKGMHDTTVSDFIRNVRIEKAEQLLVNTDLNISEVVYAIGFTSRSYFCKIFKKRYHCSPKEYKKKQLEIII